MLKPKSGVLTPFIKKSFRVFLQSQEITEEITGSKLRGQVFYLSSLVTEMESGVDDREKQCFADGEGWLYRVQAKRRLGKDKKGVQYGKRK